jgi:phage terminase large subunit-like protein
MSLDLSPLAACLQRELVGSYFADTGPFAREFYPKHMAALAATKKYNRCTIFGANRVGKTLGWDFAAACWATGIYPDWWPGRTFNKPVTGWIAGEKLTLARDSHQIYLIGQRDGDHATGGFIPKDNIERIQWGKDDVARRIIVKSRFGGLSIVDILSYEMGRAAFQSATLDFGILDEEPPANVYSEAITRTATTRGIVCAGFTSLQGVTPLIAMLAPEFAGDPPGDPEETGHWYTFIGWGDVPEAHLPESQKKVLRAGYSALEIKARTEGIPSLGSGMVWPVAESRFVIPPLEPPRHWPRAIVVDPGYHDPTGILFCAYDLENDAIYVYGEYRQNQEHAEVHAARIRKAGGWIPCIIDPAGASVTDGERVFDAYKRLLPNPIFHAEKGLTVGLQEVYDRMLDERFFVTENCRMWRSEFAMYSRDDKGRIMQGTAEHHFDLMACTRYAGLGVPKHAKQRPITWTEPNDRMRSQGYDGTPQQTTIDHGFFG